MSCRRATPSTIRCPCRTSLRGKGGPSTHFRCRHRSNCIFFCRNERRMSSVTELFSRLSGDAWRIMHPFRDVILQANALLQNPAATEEEMAECLTLWSHRQQPCQFGRVAATEDRIHLCFLRDDEVSRWRDDEIADKISEEKRLWKQRAAFDIQRAAH